VKQNITKKLAKHKRKTSKKLKIFFPILITLVLGLGWTTITCNEGGENVKINYACFRFRLDNNNP